MELLRPLVQKPKPQKAHIRLIDENKTGVLRIERLDQSFLEKYCLTIEKQGCLG